MLELGLEPLEKPPLSLSTQELPQLPPPTYHAAGPGSPAVNTNAMPTADPQADSDLLRLPPEVRSECLVRVRECECECECERLSEYKP
jgi:hypothetical protein